MKNQILFYILFIFVINSYSQEEITKEYTAFFQTISIENANYKKAKITGHLRIESSTGSTGLFLRTFNTAGESITISDVENSLVSNKNWESHSVEMELKEEASTLLFGALVSGFGNYYFDNFKFEVLDANNTWKQLEIKDSSFQKDVIDNKLVDWKEGIDEKGYRSLYYNFNRSLKSEDGNGALLVKGERPVVNLYPDIEVESTAINNKNEAVLITNINVVDVNTGKVKTQDVLLSNSKINKIAKRIKLKTSYKTIDGTGKWLTPGLIDSHIHLFQSGGLYTRPDALDLTEFKSYKEERKWLKRYAGDILKRYLRCGITTVIDVGGPIYNFEIRDKYSDVTAYPNLFLTGPLISTYQPKAFEIEQAPIIKANTAEEAIQLVKEQLPYKPDFIKIWYINTSDKDQVLNYSIVKATIDEAHKHNLKVAVHATELETAKKAIKAGADFLVHSVGDEEIDEELINLITTNTIAYIPTLVVSGNYVETFGQQMKPTKEDFSISNPIPLGSLYDSKRIEITPAFKPYLDRANAIKETIAEDEKIEALNLRKAIANNFIVATGTDAGNIGTLHATSYYDEIAAMKAAGLSNLDILKASTINGAKVLGKQNKLGSVAEGKMADVLILNANPLEDLEALKNIEYVVKGGNVYPVNAIIKDTPELLVQRQLNGYNARNIDAFLEPFSDDFEIYNYPNELSGKGKAKLKQGYIDFFKKHPKLHCELVSRTVIGNKVIDHERITGFLAEPYEAVAIYEIENNKISKVTFLRK